MALNRSELEEACDSGSKDRIDSLLAADVRLPEHDGRALFLKIIAPVQNVDLRNELLNAFIKHIKPGNSALLSHHAAAWYAFLSSAVKYKNGTVVSKVCEKIYASPALYHEMKNHANRGEFIKVLGAANEIYSFILQHKAESLMQKFEESYFYTMNNEDRITATIKLINDYFKVSENSYNADLCLARNNLVQCKLLLSKSNYRTPAPQNDSTWKKLTDISQLNFSIFKSYRDALENKKEPNRYGIPGDRRPKP